MTLNTITGICAMTKTHSVNTWTYLAIILMLKWRKSIEHRKWEIKLHIKCNQSHATNPTTDRPIKATKALGQNSEIVGKHETTTVEQEFPSEQLFRETKAGKAPREGPVNVSPLHVHKDMSINPCNEIYVLQNTPEHFQGGDKTICYCVEINYKLPMGVTNSTRV